MASKDMMTTLSFIRDFWPDFPISKEDFLSPTTDFLMRFFTNFLTEINETRHCLLNEEAANEAIDPVQDFGSEVLVYCQLSKILNKMNYTLFTLNDIYYPQAKRCHAVVKCCIHFLIYINNNLDDISNNCTSIYKKVTQCEDLNNLKQQCLQDSAENAENLARTEDVHQALKNKLDATKGRHEKMLQCKVNSEKIFFEKSMEVNKLQNENDNFDYELRDLVNREKDLQEKLVTEENFESLKNSEKYLKQTHEQLCREVSALECVTEKHREILEYAGEVKRELENLNFDTLHVNTLSELEKGKKSLQNINNQLRDELNALSNEEIGKSNSLSKTVQMMEENKKLFLDLKKKTELERINFMNSYKGKITQYRAKFEESQRLQTEISDVQEEIRQLEDKGKEVKVFACKMYKKILDASRKSTSKMNNVLLKTKKLVY